MDDKILQEPWASINRYASTSGEWIGDGFLATEIFERAFWPNGPVCIKCESTDAYLIGGIEGRTRRAWVCKMCNAQFSVRHGTWLKAGRLRLDKVLLGLVLLERRGASAAIEDLVRVGKVSPKAADRLVQEIEANCYQAPQAARVIPWERIGVWAGVAASVAVLALAAREVRLPGGGSVYAAQVVPTQGSLTDQITYTLGGREVQAIIRTPRAGFSSTKEWFEAHALKVRAANALPDLENE